MINKLSFKLYRYTFIVFLMFYSNISFSLMCPSNFSTIEIGDSIEHVVQLCGAPISRSEYKQTITFSRGGGSDISNGVYYQTRNSYGSAENNNYQKLNDVNQKTVVHTKLEYGFPQPSFLIFEDGRLVDSQLIPQ